jgi:hypothetical protein
MADTDQPQDSFDKKIGEGVNWGIFRWVAIAVVVVLMVIVLLRYKKKDGFLKNLTPVRSDTSSKLKNAISDFEEKQQDLIDSIA